MSERCKDDLPVDIKVTYGYFLVGAAPLILVDTIDSKLLVFLSSPCSCIKCKFLAHSMMNTFNVVFRYDLTVFINSSSFPFFSLSLSFFLPICRSSLYLRVGMSVHLSACLADWLLASPSLWTPLPALPSLFLSSPLPTVLCIIAVSQTAYLQLAHASLGDRRKSAALGGSS